MIISDISQSDRDSFNRGACHPLQSFEWGEFKKATGLTIVRKGIFEDNKLITPLTVTVHPLPKMGWNIGYFPKGPLPDETQLKLLTQIAQENHCLMVKLEPNIPRATASTTIDSFLLGRHCRLGRPLFTKYSFVLNLKPSEEELLKNMHPKTRYNINLAKRKGVTVILDDSPNAFKWFVKLLFEETVKRQGFYSHDPEYFAKMWQILNPAGMAHLLRAEFNGKILACFMVFVFNQKIYYPYGSSTRDYKELMAPNLLMWETIRLGKKLNCTALDMWGALGQKPNPNNSWYGFHRFKEGYGAELVESLGSYDLVLRPGLYKLYRIAEELRWLGLKLKAKLR